ncbi:Cys-tRNA(Pro) deacylase [Bifidobacterium sp.]|jgi:Cys-tRNA(Pro)/Cys-tRNA(Cys) deacylase|uniref:Cys-tRNA(Pro) deacylase n=1 Tax=Bifidobacterium sp. TaxID=41200 RepID=UPI0025C4CBD7|nr:Cys-tRNA(Pro) deacylase [Bifidobacterium sp.]MCI1636071.1 Cys-tRNA(Pro) deacylase [Bifidobacterium sp.]
MGKSSKKSRQHNSSASTPATVMLEQAGIPFNVYEYEHSSDHMDNGYGLEAVEKLGKDAQQIFKTLMADSGDQRVIGIVPVTGHLDLKALAASVGVKKLSMANPKIAQRESGYVLGGISPLGQRSNHTTVLDDSALQFDEILVSGGKRGFDIGINPHALLDVLKATHAPIATW